MTIHRTARVPGQPGVGIRVTTLAGHQHRAWSHGLHLEHPRNDPTNQPWRAINPLFAAQARREQPPAQVGIGLQLPGFTGAESGGWACTSESPDETPGGSEGAVSVQRPIKALTAWYEQLAAGNPRERAEAMETLFTHAMRLKRERHALTAQKQIFSQLAERLSAEPVERFRLRLLVQLVKLDPVQAVGPLEDRMRNDPHWNIRTAAARALVGIEDPAAELALRHMRDAPWLAQWSAENQAKMGSQRVLIAGLKANPELKSSESLQKAVREAEYTLRVLHATATVIQQFTEVVYGGVLKHEARRTSSKPKVFA